jgi:hypothetical protein
VHGRRPGQQVGPMAVLAAGARGLGLGRHGNAWSCRDVGKMWQGTCSDRVGRSTQRDNACLRAACGIYRGRVVASFIAHMPTGRRRCCAPCLNLAWATAASSRVGPGLGA